MGNRSYLRKIRGIFWSRNVDEIDLEKDKDYVIHQILMYGSLEDIGWLKKTYSASDLKKTFLHSKRRIYTPRALNFVTKIILGINKINAENYLKTPYRNIR